MVQVLQEEQVILLQQVQLKVLQVEMVQANRWKQQVVEVVEVLLGGGGGATAALHQCGTGAYWWSRCNNFNLMEVQQLLLVVELQVMVKVPSGTGSAGGGGGGGAGHGGYLVAFRNCWNRWWRWWKCNKSLLQLLWVVQV